MQASRLVSDRIQNEFSDTNLEDGGSICKLNTTTDLFNPYNMGINVEDPFMIVTEINENMNFRNQIEKSRASIIFNKEMLNNTSNC